MREELSRVVVLSSNHASFSQSERVRFFLQELIHPNSTEKEENLIIYAEGLRGASRFIQKHEQLNKFSSYVTLSDFSINDGNSVSNIPSNNLKIIGDTNVEVIYCKYSIVISLDITPSIEVANPLTGEIPFDKFLPVLKALLVSLIQPIELGTLKVRHKYITP